ncbi:MAG: hypothetical protein ACXVHW_10850, partial [Methanobacterium sp.]
MKRWAPIIIILLIVIFISGCVQPQIYNSNGISFQYPGDWNNDYKSNVQNSFGNSATVLVSLGKENNGVVVCKMNTPQVNLNDLNSIFKSNMQYNGYKFISENNMTVDGNDVQEIIFKENSSGIYGS